MKTNHLRRARIPLTAVLILLVASCLTSAQVAIVAPRSVGLSSANVAELGGIENLHQNPASLAFVQRISLSLSHRQGSDELMAEVTDFPLVTAQGVGTAMSLGVSHAGYLDTSPNRLLGYGGEVAAGFEVSARLAVGALVSANQATMDGSTVSAISSTIGLLYAPTPEVSYALVFSGLGTGISYTQSGDSAQLRVVGNPRSVHVGIATRFPSAASLRSPLLVLAMSGEKVLGQDGVLYNAGAEILPADFVAFRIGYGIGREARGFAWGLGIAIDVVRVDYALSRDGPNSIHYAAVSMEL